MHSKKKVIETMLHGADAPNGIGGNRMELKNIMEDVVLKKLDQVLDQYPDCCRCDQCRRDIAMIALNHLPARYFSTEKGEIMTRTQVVSLEFEVEVIQKLAEAIEIVSAHPRHTAEASVVADAT